MIYCLKLKDIGILHCPNSINKQVSAWNIRVVSLRKQIMSEKPEMSECDAAAADLDGWISDRHPKQPGYRANRLRVAIHHSNCLVRLQGVGAITSTHSIFLSFFFSFFLFQSHVPTMLDLPVVL